MLFFYAGPKTISIVKLLKISFNVIVSTGPIDFPLIFTSITLYPSSGFIFNVNLDPYSNVPAQAFPSQVMPLPVTAPLPVPDFRIDSGKGVFCKCRLYRAVACILRSVMYVPPSDAGPAAGHRFNVITLIRLYRK